MAVLDDEIKECFAPNLLGHGEGVGLVDPHQRGVDSHALVEAERQRNLDGFDGVVAAVWIAGIVRLAHAGHQVAGPAAIRQCPGKAKENQVAARHESGGKTAVGNLDRRLARKSGFRDGRQRAKPDHMIIAQAPVPVRVQACQLVAQSPPHAELDRVPLTVVEADRLDAREALKRPSKANRRVLPAGKKNQG
jgi:hypothetical protein